MFLVFDITTRTSFTNISTWIQQIENVGATLFFLDGQSGVEDVCCILIATHGDQLDRRQVSDEEIKERAAALNYSYFVTSAVDGQNVNEAFRAMGSLILKKSKKDESEMGSRGLGTCSV